MEVDEAQEKTYPAPKMSVTLNDADRRDPSSEAQDWHETEGSEEGYRG